MDEGEEEKGQTVILRSLKGQFEGYGSVTSVKVN